MTEADSAPTTTPPAGETPMAVALRDARALNEKFEAAHSALEAFSDAHPAPRVPESLRAQYLPEQLVMMLKHFGKTASGHEDVDGSFVWVPVAGWEFARQRKISGEEVPKAFWGRAESWLGHRHQVAAAYEMEFTAHRAKIGPQKDALDDEVQRAFAAWSDQIDTIMKMEPSAFTDLAIMATLLKEQDEDAITDGHVHAFAAAVMRLAGRTT